MNVDLDAIEARVAAATDGPWKQGDEPWDHQVYPVTGEDCGCGGGIGYVKDAEFIAHARTDIPALIAEVRRLQGLPTCDNIIEGIRIGDMPVPYLRCGLPEGHSGDHRQDSTSWFRWADAVGTIKPSRGGGGA